MSKINTALYKKDFKTAVQLLKDGEEWQISGFQSNQTYKNIIQADAFEIFDILIEKEIISLDIFEYDSFKHSLFEAFTQIPFTDTVKNYLEGIVNKIENIDEEPESQNWLDLAIKNKADLGFIQLLANNSCDINKVNTKEQTYLFATEDLALTEYLINEGVDINKKDISGQTAFFNAVKTENKELIQLYLDNGIDVNTPDNKGETIYDIICFYIINSEIFEHIAAYDPPRFNLKDSSGQSLLIKLANSPFYDNNIKILEQMLKNGADLFQQETDFYGNEITAAYLIARKPAKVFEMLVDNNFLDVERIDNKGNSWLHYVCMLDLIHEQKRVKELYKKVKLLLKSGANARLKNDEDKTPIDFTQDDNLKVKALQLMMKQS